MEEKEKLKAIKKKGVFNILKMYNLLCPKCRLLSVKAVRRKGAALQNVYKKYCAECKEVLKEKWES